LAFFYRPLGLVGPIVDPLGEQELSRRICKNDSCGDRRRALGEALTKP
jgi:hypothetical protein